MFNSSFVFLAGAATDYDKKHDNDCNKARSNHHGELLINLIVIVCLYSHFLVKFICLLAIIFHFVVSLFVFFDLFFFFFISCKIVQDVLKCIRIVLDYFGSIINHNIFLFIISYIIALF